MILRGTRWYLLLFSWCMPLFSIKATYDPATLRCVGAPMEDCASALIVENPEDGNQLILACSRGENSTQLIVQAKTSFEMQAATKAASRDAAVSPNACHSRRFSKEPMWIGSATQSPSGDRIVISDPLRQVLAFYNLSGRLDSTVSRVKGSPEFVVKPSIVSRTDSGYLLDAGESGLLYLDSSLKVVKSIDLLQSKSRTGTVNVVYSFSPERNNLLAIGDLVKANGQWATALIRVPPGAPSKFSILREIELDDPMRTFYHIGLSYLASVNGVGYILLMEESPRIYKIADKLVPMKTLTQMLARPSLPKPSGISSYPAIYRAIERSAMPAGLFGWRDSLYLLLRQPGLRAGETTWKLLKIDTRTERVVGSPMLLPTNAAHLMVIPGPQHWVLIEKGTYIGVGQQKIGNTLLLPTPWVEKAAFPPTYKCN